MDTVVIVSAIGVDELWNE